ncbi:MAG: peptidylprolyl isomerase [Solirubrobacterales bacterium]|nr:peptidylprolyl isomerase [Solirubrobacterales bacterium]MCB8970128.1 peptidylprolyl isomerase [Thermoleophilales bacterium]
MSARSFRGFTLAAAALMLLALLLGACGGDDGDGTTEASSGDCATVAAPDPVDRKAKPPKQDAPTAQGAVFETNCGSFTITFDDRNPKTAASFQSLVEQGFYDGLPIHRVVGDFLIQGGDPAGDGTGGPGYSIDEKPPPGLAYTEGTVAMAKTAAEPPGRSGSQFFIAVAADIGLTPDYALVGEVTEGMDVVKAISELAPDGGDGQPSTPVVIESAKLEG